MTKYKEMTTEEFYSILEDLIYANPSLVFSNGDAVAILAEHLNNEVLDEWEQRKEREK